MATNNPFIAFVVEIIQRLGMKSPKLFVWLQWIGSGLTALTGLPWLIDKIAEWYGYIPPAAFIAIENKTAALCGIVATFIAALPIKGTTVAVGADQAPLKAVDTDKLPLTKKEDEKEIAGKPIVPVQTK